jgi:hypothetical protein
MQAVPRQWEQLDKLEDPDDESEDDSLKESLIQPKEPSTEERCQQFVSLGRGNNAFTQNACQMSK